MSGLERILSLVPRRIKSDFRQKLRETFPSSADSLLSSLYWPAVNRAYDVRKITWSRPAVIDENYPGESLPIPPEELRMGYGADKKTFLSIGKRTADLIRKIVEREKIPWSQKLSVMEWGCATSRVLRHFEEEARHGDFWGVDQAGEHISWCKENLSPPFNFLTCTAYPHLPFEDRRFALVYGISVFTHLYQLIDAWLVEFRRLLAPGGYAVFTIHDEHTWNVFTQHPDRRPRWLPHEDLARGLNSDLMVFFPSEFSSWDSTYTFFRTEWIRAEWGRYFEVVSIEPYAEDYQTAVVLRRPAI